MNKLEQIEKLREKANVTYDEAKQAYEAADGDLLEALIILERQGKVAPPAGGGYHSSEKVNTDDYQEDERQATGWDNFVETLEKIGKFCVDIIDKGNKSKIEVIHNDDSKVKIPVTVIVLLFLFLPHVTVPAAVISLFFGFRYRAHWFNSNGEL
ncbi:MAG: DUF4342 domain-containing protein [Firmicutes bacterium]|nr:DUF4342 domain-containing protein [Bacillota bacterium]